MNFEFISITENDLKQYKAMAQKHSAKQTR